MHQGTRGGSSVGMIGESEALQSRDGEKLR